jgi:hypothetical protein
MKNEEGRETKGSGFNEEGSMVGAGLSEFY